MHLRPFLILLFTLIYNVPLQAQLTVSGTVYDNSKNNFIENVRVISTGGLFAVTDSLGRYHISVLNNDSISFIYDNKPTHKFPVAQIKNTDEFDISLKVTVQSKYTPLRDVIVYGKTYRQDSIENRQTYADIFEYTKPRIRSGISPGGVAGADVNELINIFRFRRNRQLKAFQQRLELQEKDKYIDHRFSKAFVKRLTALDGKELDDFLLLYRPSYEFTLDSSELEFNQYIINAYYHFRRLKKLNPQRAID
jgi:hypothetical protein